MRSVLKKLEEISSLAGFIEDSTQNWIISRKNRPERISNKFVSECSN
ncbi:MAG: hypothetical protein CM1200mP30_27020 [Pseudomonadota bacterium]|nr:MAG: hypothetical protein CM1200mP30_27020 [Pseudomonadota bacterium]